jgi:hypothetical protein
MTVVLTILVPWGKAMIESLLLPSLALIHTRLQNEDTDIRDEYKCVRSAAPGFGPNPMRTWAFARFSSGQRWSSEADSVLVSTRIKYRLNVTKRLDTIHIPYTRACSSLFIEHRINLRGWICTDLLQESASLLKNTSNLTQPMTCTNAAVNLEVELTNAEWCCYSSLSLWNSGRLIG